MTRPYFPSTPGGRWAASRVIDGQWVALIEGVSLYDSNDAIRVLLALGIEPSTMSLDRYFPMRENKGRCPTNELMELFSHLAPGRGEAIGV